MKIILIGACLCSGIASAAMLEPSINSALNTDEISGVTSSLFVAAYGNSGTSTFSSSQHVSGSQSMNHWFAKPLAVFTGWSAQKPNHSFGHSHHRSM